MCEPDGNQESRNVNLGAQGCARDRQGCRNAHEGVECEITVWPSTDSRGLQGGQTGLNYYADGPAEFERHQSLPVHRLQGRRTLQMRR
jgi:hypothetical protein